MPDIFDVFNNDAFNVITLSSLVNNQPFMPGQVGQLGIFEEEGINTTTVGFDLIDGTIELVGQTARGGPGESVGKDLASTVALSVPHFQRDDAVSDDEVQNRRQLGENADQRETLQNLITSRSMKHFRDFDVTLEHQRMGALSGIVLNKAGGTMYNLFTTFGVSAQDTKFFDLGAASPANGALRDACDDVVETVENALANDPYDHVHAICGRTFYKALLKHKEVTDSFKNTLEAAQLRQGLPRKFEFGNIVFERYRTGGISGLIADDQCKIFPVGVPGLYKTFFAPADYEETVNTPGLPRYVKQVPMLNGKGRLLEIQTNPLQICRKPRVLITGDKDAS
jgi:hypothetical protein